MSLTNKKILIQGAGRGHLGLISTCKKLGVRTIVTGLRGNYPCIPLADKFVECDIRDKEAILEIARRENVDGIIICCSDTGLETVGYVNDRMGFKGISELAAQLCSDKLRMKEKLVSGGVRTARFLSVMTAEDIDRASSTLAFPMILKATDLQGSRGIFIVNSADELHDAYERVCKLSRNPYCVLEEFIAGNEFGVQAFVADGEILFVLPHGDETVRCGTNVPVGHFMPLSMNYELKSDTIKQVTQAIRALQLDNCAVNVDLIERDNEAFIIELTGRVGANCLPELTGNYLGLDYYEMILSAALGESPALVFNSRSGGQPTKARMIKSKRTGRIKSMKIPNYVDGRLSLFVKAGDEIREFTNSNDAIGQIIIKGESLEVCDDKISTILESINIEVQ